MIVGEEHTNSFHTWFFSKGTQARTIVPWLGEKIRGGICRVIIARADSGRETITMSIGRGTRIGPYEVLSPLGEGGMGVVFRALDTRLQREVALKLLPDHFADDPERLARFQREAQVLATLNHPNIAQIHGLEESEGNQCIVMELVETNVMLENTTTGYVYVEMI